MSHDIHPTAIIENGALLEENVHIAPFCHVGPDVRLAKGVKLHTHVVISGRTNVGAGTQIYPFASIGTPPQDLKYQGEKTRLHIGENCCIREHVTINPGTKGGGGLTRIGNNCLLMIGAHVAHDCLLGENVILVNNACLSGHVLIEDFVIVGGVSAVHQFVRLGKHAFIGGQTGVEHDIIPYGLALGNRAELGGVNLTGLKRHNFPRKDIHAIRKAYHLLFEQGANLQERAKELAQTFADNPQVLYMINFILSETKRGFTTSRNRPNPEPSKNA